LRSSGRFGAARWRSRWPSRWRSTTALLAEARKQPELDAQQLRTTFGSATSQLQFALDRAEAKQFGVNLTDVFDTMQVCLGSLYVWAMCLMVVKLAGALSVRTRHSSTRNSMSITQCNCFRSFSGRG